MKTLMNQLLESLRQRVAENMSTIRQNEAEIRVILTEPLSNQRSSNLSSRYVLSKKILAENAENLKIQNMIVAFLGNYKDLPMHTDILKAINTFEKNINNQETIESDSQHVKPIDKKSKSREETSVNIEQKETTQKVSSPKIFELQNNQLNENLFELTASGKLAFNKAHPKFNDDQFYNQLLDYHTLREEYEICAKLVKTRK